MLTWGNWPRLLCLLTPPEGSWQPVSNSMRSEQANTRSLSTPTPGQTHILSFACRRCGAHRLRAWINGRKSLDRCTASCDMHSDHPKSIEHVETTEIRPLTGHTPPDKPRPIDFNKGELQRSYVNSNNVLIRRNPRVMQQQMAKLGQIQQKRKRPQREDLPLRRRKARKPPARTCERQQKLATWTKWQQRLHS